MAKTREFNGNVFTDNGKGLYNAKLKKYLIYRPYPLLVDEVREEDKVEPDNKQEYTSKQLKDKFGTDNTELINLGKEKEDQVAKIEDDEESHNYKVSFGFKDLSSIRDDAFEDAKDYLEKEDLAQYLDGDLKNKVDSLKYELVDPSLIEVKIHSKEALNSDDLAELKSFIEGQNSDGLGEGFEQQDFAEAYYDPDTGDGPFTFDEVLDMVQRNYDEMDVRDYVEYIDDSDLLEWTDDYIRDGFFNIDFNDYLVNEGIIEEDSEEYNMDRYDLGDNYPDEYDNWMDDEKEEFIDSNYFEQFVPSEVIEDAKNEVAQNDPRYNENLWGNGMTSMEWDIGDIKEETNSNDDNSLNDYINPMNEEPTRITKEDWELARPNETKLRELIDNGLIVEEDVNEMALKYNGYDEIISAMKTLDYDTEKYTDIDSIYNDGSLDEMDLNRIGYELLSEMSDDDIKDLMRANDISYPEDTEESINVGDKIEFRDNLSNLREGLVVDKLDNFDRIRVRDLDGFTHSVKNNYVRLKQEPSLELRMYDEDKNEFKTIMKASDIDEVMMYADENKNYGKVAIYDEDGYEITPDYMRGATYRASTPMRKEEKSVNAAEIASNYYNKLSSMSDNEKRSLMRELGYNYNSLNTWSGSQLHEIVRKTLLREKNRI